MGIEPMAFGLALRRFNHWTTETPHLNHHIQLRYRTADNVAIALLFPALSPFYIQKELQFSLLLHSVIENCYMYFVRGHMGEAGGGGGLFQPLAIEVFDS